MPLPVTNKLGLALCLYPASRVCAIEAIKLPPNDEAVTRCRRPTLHVKQLGLVIASNGAALRKRVLGQLGGLGVWGLFGHVRGL